MDSGQIKSVTYVTITYSTAGNILRRFHCPGTMMPVALRCLMTIQTSHNQWQRIRYGLSRVNDQKLLPGTKILKGVDGRFIRAT